MSAPSFDHDCTEIRLHRSATNRLYWTGERALDCAHLRHCDCPRVFTDDMYDEVMYKVSERGFFLVTPVEPDDEI